MVDLLLLLEPDLDEDDDRVCSDIFVLGLYMRPPEEEFLSE